MAEVFIGNHKLQVLEHQEIHLLYHLHKEVLAEMHNQLNIQITALEAAEEEHQLLEIMEQHLEQVDLLQEMVVVEQHHYYLSLS